MGLAVVMAGLVPAIHVFLVSMPGRKTWMRGTSPRMTTEKFVQIFRPVGWVERSETHGDAARPVMGFAALNPSYAQATA